MSDISLAITKDDVGPRMAAAGPAVVRAVDGAAKAAAVHFAERVWANSPVDTGDMQFSTYLTQDEHGDWIVGQVAPYASYVDARAGHMSGTFYAEADAAFRFGASIGDQLLRTGGGPGQVPSRFPTEGVYRNTRGQRGWRR